MRDWQPLGKVIMPTTTIDTRMQRDGYGAKGMASTTSDDVAGQMRGSVRALLGDSIRLSDRMSLGDLDTYTGPTHSTTGIPYAIHGTAKVVSTKVATWLAGFDDPIKAIMPVAVHEQQKIIIRRKYVVGGSAIITPERAPARTVAVREDEREVVLTRYGGDLEMNLNLFLRPNDAREELEMKLGAQRQELENVLVRLGYEAIMAEGTNIVEALARANPAMANMDHWERQQAIEKTYVNSVFGCINKHNYPVENLLAAAAKANLYTPTGARRQKLATMIVPPGMMDLTKYTRQCNMQFSISGLKTTEQGTISLPLSNGVEDKISGLRILVHMPPPSNANGAAHPQVESSGLMRVAAWATVYPLGKYIGPAINTEDGTGFTVKSPDATHHATKQNTYYDDVRITDFKCRNWATLDQFYHGSELLQKYGDMPGYKYYLTDKGFRRGAVRTDTEKPSDSSLFWSDDVELIVIRPRFACLMQSAILATNPQDRAGELLMAYPQTGVSTSQTDESMKMQLRVYMGAAVYNPENYVVYPHVAFAGAVSGHGARFCMSQEFNPDEHDLILAFKSKNTECTDLLKDKHFRATAGAVFYKDYLDKQDNDGNWAQNPEDKVEEPKIMGTDGEGVPLTFWQGRTLKFSGTHGKWETATRNYGHLGRLDDPERSDVIEGMQKYIEVPPEGSYKE